MKNNSFNPPKNRPPEKEDLLRFKIERVLFPRIMTFLVFSVIFLGISLGMLFGLIHSNDDLKFVYELSLTISATFFIVCFIPLIVTFIKFLSYKKELKNLNKAH